MVTYQQDNLLVCGTRGQGKGAEARRWWMDDEQRRAAKARLVEGMLQGQSWQDAVIASGLDLWRSGADRLTQRVCVYGAAA